MYILKNKVVRSQNECVKTFRGKWGKLIAQKKKKKIKTS